MYGTHMYWPRIVSFAKTKSGENTGSPPTSSWCVPETPLTLARCGSGRRPSGGRSGGDGGPIERDIGQPPPPQPVFFNTARSDGPKNSDKELEVEKEVRYTARCKEERFTV